MAITRAQQFRQMLEDGGMLVKPGRGKRPGYRGDDAARASGRSKGKATSRDTTRAAPPSGTPQGDGPASDKFRQSEEFGLQDPSVYGATGKQYDPAAAKAAAIAQGRFKKKDSIRKFAEGYTKNTRKFLYNTFPNNPRNELDYLKQLPAAQRALLSPALRAKLEALELDEDQDLLDTAKTKFTFDEFEELKNFQPTEGLNFAEYAAKFKGAPGLLYSGDVGNLIKTRNPDGTFSYRRDFSQDDPSTMESDLEARLRLLEEQRKKVEEPVAENPLANLFARLAADGGMIKDAPRAGFRQAGIAGREYDKADTATKEAISREQDRGATPTRDDFRDQRKTATQQLRNIPTTITQDTRTTPAVRKGILQFLINRGLNATGIPTDDLGKILSGVGVIESLKQPQLEVPGLDLQSIRQNPYANFDNPMQMADALTLPTEGAMGLNLKTLRDFKQEGFTDDQIREAVEGGYADDLYKSIIGPVPAAEGGRIGAMEGGIMDLETGRQMYFLGKLVKKATRAVKKIVKSPIGKAAILGGAMYFGGGGAGGLKKFFGAGTFNPFREKIAGVGTVSSGLGKLLSNIGMTDMVTGKLTKGGMAALIGGGVTLAPLLFGKQEDDDDTIDPSMLGPRLDIAKLLANPYQATLGTGFRRTAADGGRIGYQEGSKEPVAKKTMPLLDMDGQEMDLRDNGGFVPIGRMEKADDVPARLSKNEFVFTADAVRNAGDGDIDKGAEVMYNMMKNLEDGGNVSEESQGLEGARNMFQTAQRLEEVL